MFFCWWIFLKFFCKYSLFILEIILKIFGRSFFLTSLTRPFFERVFILLNFSTYVTESPNFSFTTSIFSWVWIVISKSFLNLNNSFIIASCLTTWPYHSSDKYTLIFIYNIFLLLFLPYSYQMMYSENLNKILLSLIWNLKLNYNTFHLKSKVKTHWWYNHLLVCISKVVLH